MHTEIGGMSKHTRGKENPMIARMMGFTAHARQTMKPVLCAGVLIASIVGSSVAAWAANITVISPNGGEDIAAHSTYTITWHAQGLDPNGRLLIYYKDIANGADWVFLDETPPRATAFT
jgi:hypothetical protein